MKYKSNKLRKLENNRYSIIVDNMNYCVECGKKRDDLNEIFPGRNRQNSMKYGLVIPMCRSCHRKYTDNRELQLKWMKIGQKAFEDNYDEEFIKIFRRNYID